MSLNGSGVRDIARVLHVSPSTVIRELKKKKPYLQAVNQKLLETVQPEQVEVEIFKVEEKEGKEEPESGIESSELDEMWSFVVIRKILDGYGMELTAVPEKFWRMFSADEKMKFFSS
jgi:IS30 family transposase